MPLSVQFMRAYDEADPLRHLRHRFALAQDVIYLDGSTFPQGTGVGRQN